MLVFRRSTVSATARPTLGDLGGSVSGIDQDIAALRTKSRGDSLGESVNTLEQAGTSLDTELELLFAIGHVSWENFENNGSRSRRGPEAAFNQEDWIIDVPCEQNVAAGGSGRRAGRKGHAWKRPRGGKSGKRERAAWLRKTKGSNGMETIKKCMEKQPEESLIRVGEDGREKDRAEDEAKVSKIFQPVLSIPRAWRQKQLEGHVVSSRGCRVGGNIVYCQLHDEGVNLIMSRWESCWL